MEVEEKKDGAFELRDLEEKKGKVPRLEFLKQTSYNWSIKIAIKGKQMANEPAWRCNHPDETYFVNAIREGVKNLLQDS